jgi:hypothetical protein
MQDTDLDPKGLIRESYRIEGITIEECRSIFLDWALGVPGDIPPQDRIRALLGIYGDNIDHPMTVVLTAGLKSAEAPRRRGGRKARVGEA